MTSREAPLLDRLPASSAVIAEITATVERLCGLEETSTARARQLRWFANELRLALAHPDFAPGRPVQTAADLFQAQAVGSYLDLGHRGELRMRATRAAGGVASPASMRVREDCIKIIARELGIPADLRTRAASPPAHEPVDALTRSELRAYLLARAENPPTLTSHVRLLAIIGTVLDTGARVGELCAMTVQDLELGGRSDEVRIERRPQSSRDVEPTIEQVRLSQGTVAALRVWLTHRQELVEQFQLGVKALWVSVAGNHAGLPSKDGDSIRRPPGMPLRPRGLQRAYTRAVVELNDQLAGTPGWKPLPYRLELLRRAIDVEGRTAVEGTGQNSGQADLPGR